MAEEVLSQNEIDDLLSALSTGEKDASQFKQKKQDNRVRTYDFKRALRFSKDQIRSLTRIHENFARLLTTYFSAQLRTYVQISVASVDQVPYEEFIRSVPKMTILNIFSVAPLNGRIIFEFNPNIAYAMLDRLLGGKGNGVNKVDSLTEIETILMSQLFDRAMDNLQEAWSSMIHIDPVLEEFEVNPQFLQLVSPNETVIVVSLNTTIGESSGMINICIPHVVLEPIVSKLSVHYWMQSTSTENDPAEYQNLTSTIEDAIVEMRAILGQTDISVEDFLNLTKNDVIQLTQDTDQPLLLQVDEEPKFYVQAGKQKSKMAVQIIDEVKRRKENDE